MKNITSKDNEKIKYVVKLSLNKKFRESEKKFVVEGFKAIYDAYCFGLNLNDIFIHPSIINKFDFINENKITIVEDNILKKISTTDSYSKCIAVFDMLDYTFDDLKTKNTLILLENIKDPGNLGTIIRSANAFGIDGIILYGDTIDIYNPKVIRSSVGNFLKIPILKTKDIEVIKRIFKTYTFYATKVDTDIDLKKVVMMLALHELEEIVIGDLTQFQISREEKARLGHEAVRDVLAPLAIHDDLEKFVFEFDERKTKEARFAYFCDKLECDIQAKLYDLDGAVSLEKQEDNISFYDQRVQELLSTDSSWSTMWLTFSQEKYHYDLEFLEISNYVLEHDLNVEKKKLKEIQKK